MDDLSFSGLLTVADVARKVGRSPLAIYQAIHRGAIRGTRILGRGVFTAGDVDRYLQRREMKARRVRDGK